jgi:hypothetical protein
MPEESSFENGCVGYARLQIRVRRKQFRCIDVLLSTEVENQGVISDRVIVNEDSSKRVLITIRN